MTGTKKAVFFLLALFTLNIYPGIYYRWYNLGIFDASLHFLGGFFVAMLVLSYYNSDFKRNSQIFGALSIISVTALVGIIWEFTEYLGSIYLTEPIWRTYQIHAYFIGDLADTLGDLLMDVLGASLFIALHLLRSAYAKKVERLPEQVSGSLEQE